MDLYIGAFLIYNKKYVIKIVESGKINKVAT